MNIEIRGDEILAALKTLADHGASEAEIAEHLTEAFGNLQKDLVHEFIEQTLGDFFEACRDKQPDAILEYLEEELSQLRKGQNL